MAITYNVELSAKADRNGFHSVMIRLHQKGQPPVRILTSVKIDNPKNRFRLLWGKWVKSHPNATALNSQILSEHTRIKEQSEQQLTITPTLTPKQIADKFRNGTSDNYFEQAQSVVDTVKSAAFSTYNTYQTALNHFKRYAGESLTIDSLKPGIAAGFAAWLVKQPMPNRKGKRMNPASANLYVSKMRIIHRNILISTGIAPKRAELLSPFADCSPLLTKKTYKAKLSESQINAIQRVVVKAGTLKLTHADALSIWLLANALAGARISDVLLLRYGNFTLNSKGNPETVTYEMLKTGTRVTVPVLAQALTALAGFWESGQPPENFVLPGFSLKLFTGIKNRNDLINAPFDVRKKIMLRKQHVISVINSRLADIEKGAGLTDKLRTHNARHSFADLARRIMQEGKISLSDIQNMLGHSNQKTTLGYMSELTGQDTSEAVKKVFGK